MKFLGIICMKICICVVSNLKNMSDNHPLEVAGCVRV